MTIRSGNDAISETIGTNWKTFTSIDDDFVIEFHNDKGSKNDVFFKSEENHSITFPPKWKEWECDTKTPNRRCSTVQKGTFAWRGKYKIKFLPKKSSDQSNDTRLWRK